MTSSSSTSIEDLSRFATSTASSSKTSLELIVDQEKDMSVSLFYFLIDLIFIHHRMDKEHSGLIDLSMIYSAWSIVVLLVVRCQPHPRST
jgi:hypothetical protein